MKINELINLDIQIAKKKEELQQLKEEAELIQMMIKLDLNESETIDIEDVYLFATSEGTYFVKRVTNGKVIRPRIHLMNIFDNRILVDKYDDYGTWSPDTRYLYNYKICYLKPIKEVFDILNSYTNNKIPKRLLQKLYYDINNIDSKTLKKCLDIQN